MEKIVLGIAGVLSLTHTQLPVKEKEEKELPNILWIVSEDNSAYFTGCYGNSFATTLQYRPVGCSGIFIYTCLQSERSFIAVEKYDYHRGLFGFERHEQMRSNYPKSEGSAYYPEYLRKAGYYCTNNSKTDYNTW